MHEHSGYLEAAKIESFNNNFWFVLSGTNLTVSCSFLHLFVAKQVTGDTQQWYLYERATYQGQMQTLIYHHFNSDTLQNNFDTVAVFAALSWDTEG